MDEEEEDKRKTRFGQALADKNRSTFEDDSDPFGDPIKLEDAIDLSSKTVFVKGDIVSSEHPQDVNPLDEDAGVSYYLSNGELGEAGGSKYYTTTDGTRYLNAYPVAVDAFSEFGADPRLLTDFTL